MPVHSHRAICQANARCQSGCRVRNHALVQACYNYAVLTARFELMPQTAQGSQLNLFAPFSSARIPPHTYINTTTTTTLILLCIAALDHPGSIALLANFTTPGLP
mmetsp:Transcript_22702/g.47186  ORF Transcript_22702/g.47186 Transcript_22702/m.47186 type:complete len:105 (-) Transcript_22702:289-603(-)